MWEGEVGALAVTNDAGDPVAMVTDRDICMAAYTQGKPLSEIGVATAASHCLRSVQPEDHVDYALSLMAHSKVRRLPVVDRGGNLVGIVSFSDIVRGQCVTEGTGGELRFAQVATTMDEVCRPHAR
jgi:CBS domain-containing protein